MLPLLSLLPLLPLLSTVSARLTHPEETELLRSGPRQIGLYQALVDQRRKDGQDEMTRLGGDDQQTIFSSSASISNKHHPKYRAHCHSQPVSHFSAPSDPHHNQTFCMRFWYDDQYYQSGGPVFVLDGGETSGENRLPFLETGIVARLAKEFSGLPIILEHRYYGESYPFGSAQTLSTDGLRFLNNAEALADSAAFLRDLQIDGLGDLRAGPEGNGTKFIYYGGSYAGARAAHMRKLFPTLVHGAIASSAVTHAEIDYWEYMDAIRLAAPPSCIAHVERSVLMVDAALDESRERAQAIKKQFGLEKLEDDDFASVLTTPLGGWQGRNWDPEVGSNSFYTFCDALASGVSPSQSPAEEDEVVLENYAKYIRKLTKKCPKQELEALGLEKKVDVVACFGTHNATKFQEVGLDQSWRTWVYQTCTEWGYFQGAPPDPSHPRIVSNRLTLEYGSKLCQQAFPPGKLFQIPRWPNVSVVNDLGDFALSEDRLAFIDGDSDPWKPATPNSQHAPRRANTILRPNLIIPDAVHHFDENGMRNPSQEPKRIRAVHEDQIAFVGAWLKMKSDWEK